MRTVSRIVPAAPAPCQIARAGGWSQLTGETRDTVSLPHGVDGIHEHYRLTWWGNDRRAASLEGLLLKATVRDRAAPVITREAT
jgi:hypothetical protein